MGTVSREIIAYCKTAGVRCAAKKLIVADQLEAMNGYTDAVSIFLKLRNSYVKISFATVYQSLDWLISNGFVERKIENGDYHKRKENRYRIRKSRK